MYGYLCVYFMAGEIVEAYPFNVTPGDNANICAMYL